MIGGKTTDFIEKTTYEECSVLYKGIKYFFHGLIFNKEENLYSYDIDVWDNDGNYIKTVFSEKNTSMETCMALAHSSPIFDGKTFWEAEPEMEWVEW